MITPEQLGIQRRGADYIRVEEGNGHLDILMRWKDGREEEYHYEGIFIEGNQGQRYSPIKWVLLK